MSSDHGSTLLLSIILAAFAWGLVAVVPAVIAYLKGHSFEAWWAVGFFLSPFVALLLSYGVPPNWDQLTRRKVERGERKKCPSCAEAVYFEALRCSHCSQDMGAALATPQPLAEVPASPASSA